MSETSGKVVENWSKLWIYVCFAYYLEIWIHSD